MPKKRTPDAPKERRAAKKVTPRPAAKKAATGGKARQAVATRGATKKAAANKGATRKPAATPGGGHPARLRKAAPKKYEPRERPKRHEPLSLTTHRDLRANIRNICERLNDMPDLARMLLVNPILALEDAGVQMSPEVKQHVMNALRFPPSLVERRAQLEFELRHELAALGVRHELPLTSEQRAHLVFNVLKLKPRETDAYAAGALTSKQARAYAREHSLVAKLAEYERARQGRLIFYPREVYETYKAGLKQHHWIKSVKFKV